MRQLLIFSFVCNVYKKNPLVRIYANDLFLDEFNLPHTHSTKELDAVFYNFNNNNFLTINKSFLKILEIDTNTKNLDIKINIKNNDSNYNNGFMTNSTLMLLPYFFIISENLLKRIKTLEEDYCFSKKNYSNIKLHLKKNYNNRGILIYNIVEDIEQVEQERSNNICMGGDRNMEYSLICKHGVWIPKYCLNNRNINGFWRIGWIESLKEVLNKYKQYEDQRSSNT